MEKTNSLQAKHFFPSGPNKFKDPRVTFIQETEKYVFKDDSQNLSYEWDDDKKAWFPMWNEQLMASQQSAYSVEGVDETEEVIKPKDKRKAKIYTMEDESAKKKAKSRKKENYNISICFRITFRYNIRRNERGIFKIWNYIRRY
jgi:HIV Tat-specific factor 1